MFKTMFKNGVRNRVQNHVQNRVQIRVQIRVPNRVQNRVRNHIQKVKNIVNKNTSFLKTTDTKKRDFIVNEFLKTKHPTQLFVRT